MNILDELKTNNYTIIASNGYKSSDNGIYPVINKINENREYFKDLVVADRIIGKASAMLFCLSKVKEVYCLVLSKAGKEALEKHSIKYHYEELVEYIINRNGDDMCPMEKAIKNIDDIELAYMELNKKIK